MENFLAAAAKAQDNSRGVQRERDAAGSGGGSRVTRNHRQRPRTADDADVALGSSTRFAQPG